MSIAIFSIVQKDFFEVRKYVPMAAEKGNWRSE